MSMLPVLLRKFTGSNEILVSQCSLLVLEACLAPRRRGFHVDEHPIECGNNSLTHPPLNTDRGASKSKFLSIDPSLYTDCADRQWLCEDGSPSADLASSQRLETKRGEAARAT